MKKYTPCIECEGQPCICEDNGKWAAHCMDCENQIGKRGFYDPCAKSEEEAVRRWNDINTEPTESGNGNYNVGSEMKSGWDYNTEKPVKWVTGAALISDNNKDFINTEK